MKRFLPCLFLTLTSPIFASNYATCVGPNAFSDAAHTLRTPNNDWICQLTEDASGARCPRNQQRNCQGGTLPGPHDVPNGGIYWFHSNSTVQDLDVRCTCGCFAPETQILTENGPHSIDFLLDVSKRQALRVFTRAEPEKGDYLDLSPELRAPQFTRGPEDKPLRKLTLSDGTSLRLTDKHPVLVIRHDREAMIRSKDLVPGDILIDRYGSRQTLASVVDDETGVVVINFASAAPGPLAHIVIANGIQVGDNLWQKNLDVFHSRQEIRETADLVYLDSIIEKD